MLKAIGLKKSYNDLKVLKGVDLHVLKGEVVAIVGASGAGKSTVFSLLLRFYDSEAGRISIDGQDIRAVTLETLRGQLALVTQDPFLFDDTIARLVEALR